MKSGEKSNDWYLKVCKVATIWMKWPTLCAGEVCFCIVVLLTYTFTGFWKYICIKYWHNIKLRAHLRPGFFSCLCFAESNVCPVSNLALLSRMPHAKPTTRQSPPPPAVWLLPLLQEGVLTENYAAFKWKLYRLWHGPYVVTNLILHHCPPGCCAQTRCSLTFATRTNKNRDKKIY